MINYRYCDKCNIKFKETDGSFVYVKGRTKWYCYCCQ